MVGGQQPRLAGCDPGATHAIAPRKSVAALVGIWKRDQPSPIEALAHRSSRFPSFVVCGTARVWRSVHQLGDACGWAFVN